MISCDICLSLLDLLYSVWRSLAPSMFLQKAFCPSVLQLSNIPLYVCTVSASSILLLMDTGCFHVLAIVNSALMNLEVHASFWISNFPRCTPRCGIVIPYYISIFEKFRCCFLTFLSFLLTSILAHQAPVDWIVSCLNSYQLYFSKMD